MVRLTSRASIATSALALFFGLGSAIGQDYKRLFDGASLKGWVSTGRGAWTVVDSALVGTLPTNNPESYLISEMKAKDFLLRLKFRWVKGNGGVNFRNQRKGDLAMGIQVDLDGPRTSGNLYDNEKAKYVTTSDSISRWYKTEGWNDLAIEARGTRIQVFLNGKRTADYQDVGGHPEGVFAFQLHVNAAMEVRFRDIEMLDLAPTPILLPSARPAAVPGSAFSLRIIGGRPAFPVGGSDGKLLVGADGAQLRSVGD